MVYLVATMVCGRHGCGRRGVGPLLIGVLGLAGVGLRQSRSGGLTDVAADHCRLGRGFVLRVQEVLYML